MSLETATYIDSLVTSNPDGTDQRSTADDHLRLIKACLKRSFPMIGGAVSASAAAVTFVNDLSASVQAQLNALRDGSATAANAVNASTARSASDALALGGFAAAAYPRLAATQNTFTGIQRIAAAAPRIELVETDGVANNTQWQILLDGEALVFRVADDASLSATAYLTINRTANVVDSLAFAATSMTFNGQAVDNPLQLNSVPAASYARLDVVQTFAKGTGSTIVALTDGATITPNCEDGNVFRVVLGGNRTLAAPSNPRSGQTIVLHILQDGTGGRTLAWNSIYHFAGTSDPTLTTTANACDVFAFNYDSVSGVWRQAGLNVG